MGSKSGGCVKKNVNNPSNVECPTICAMEGGVGLPLVSFLLLWFIFERGRRSWGFFFVFFGYFCLILKG